MSEKFKIKFEEITACAEEILQFLSDLEANEDAVNYIDSYIYEECALNHTVPKEKFQAFHQN